jgi:flagellar basal-body rod modification protein FlgD
MNPISESTPSMTASQLSSSLQTTSLGKEDFLKLLVSQLQNQDPLNPSDPTQFTAQLAQFSSLEQLTNINENLQSLAGAQNLGALSFIGQDVIAEEGGFQFNSEPLRLGYRLSAPADEVTLFVQDGLGRTVASIPGAETSTGEHFLSWDGLGSNGQMIPAGEYRLLVAAVKGKDQAVDASSLVQARVSGVDFEGSSVMLRTDSGSFSMSRVQSVRGR